MNTSIATRHFFSLLVLFACIVAATASAQQASEESNSRTTRQANAVSLRVYEALQEVQALIESEDFDTALRQVEDLLQRDLSDYERSQTLTYEAFVLHSMGRSADAVRTYEALLQIEDLEMATRKRTLYTLAQLNTSLDEYSAALRHLDAWFALETGPAPDAYVLRAQILYQLDRHLEMIDPIETAISLARELNKPVKEDWLALLGFAYFQTENYSKVRDVYIELLEGWPKKRYWMTLAGTYTELGETDKVVAIYEALHSQGMLTSEAELVTLAQLYLQHDIPYKAGLVLESALAQDQVEPAADIYRLMSQAWALAQEDERAIPALRAAADISEDGELDIRLANSLLNLGRYDECVTAARSGLQKGELRKPADAQITLGMCLYNTQAYGDASGAFRESMRDTRYLLIAQQWLTVIDREVERDRQIYAVESSTEAQLRQLAERRLAASE